MVHVHDSMDVYVGSNQPRAAILIPLSTAMILWHHDGCIRPKASLLLQPLQGNAHQHHVYCTIRVCVVCVYIRWRNAHDLSSRYGMVRLRSQQVDVVDMFAFASTHYCVC